MSTLPPLADPELSRFEAVAALYQLLLGRAADPGGLAGHVARLRGGEPLETVAVDIMGSTEFLARPGAADQADLLRRAAWRPASPPRPRRRGWPRCWGPCSGWASR